MFDIHEYPWGLPVGTKVNVPVDKSVDCVYNGIRGVVHCAIKTVDKNIFHKNDVR